MDFSFDTDSMVSYQEAQSQREKEKILFQKRLAAYPHSFQLENADSLGFNQLKRLKVGLETALKVGYKTDLETARARNVLAYFLHRLDIDEEALQQLGYVLGMESQQNNLVTLANKAVILWRQHRLTDADELIETLQRLHQRDEFAYLVIRAKAELAFSYTRLGPRFGSNAITLFLEVIPEAQLLEKWLWMFGLALTRRRLLRALPPLPAAMPSSEMMKEQRNLLDLFLEIANGCPCDNLKAKTYAEMATLLNFVWRSNARAEFIRKAGLDLEGACVKALELDNNDNSVLCKCGRLFRYIRKLDKSCKLLEKALSIRPSSTAYHHLGLTYKSMATREIYQDNSQTSTRYSNPRGRYSRESSSTSYSDLAKQLGRMSLDTPTHYSGGGSDSGIRRGKNPTAARQRYSVDEVSATGRPDLDNASKSTESGATARYQTPTSNLSKNKDIRRMQKMIKSPPDSVTCFKMDGKYVKDALKNFELSVEFSRGENSRALYDLALFQKALKKLEPAKESLQKMMKHGPRLYPTDHINAYEQMGLIMKEMAEAEIDEAANRRLLNDSNKLLLLALQTAAKYYSMSKDSIPQVWSSFSVLMQFVDNSEKNPHEKLQEKAKLLQLIDSHKQSLNLLSRIKEMDPTRAHDPEYLKLNIEAYVSSSQFEEALGLISLLECTPQGEETLRLFEDKYVPKITLQAARDALLQGSTIAKTHILTVFRDTVVPKSDDPTSSEDTDASSDSQEDEIRNLTILHEDWAQDAAFTLAEILEDVCGLTVYVQGRDGRPGRLELEVVVRMIRRGSLLVVLAGEKPVSRELRYFISYAAKRQSTVTLLLGKVLHVPEMLNKHRSMVFPEKVLSVRRPSAHQPMPRSLSQDEGHRSNVNALIEVLSFFVNVKIDIVDTA